MAYQIGYYTSIACLLATAIYTIAQLISPPLIPILSFPLNEILIITPSLLLALSYVVLLNVIEQVVDNEKKVWTKMAKSFGVMYAVLASFVYIIQLASVIPNTFSGNAMDVEFLRLTSSKAKAHWIQAVDGFAYFLMSISALFIAPAFPSNRSLRASLLAHGLIAPVILLPLWKPALIYIGSVWFITANLLFARWVVYFKTLLREQKNATIH